MSLVSYVFAVVPVVGMCSSDKTLCGFWWVRVDSDRSFPATWSLRCSVCFISLCLWSFLMVKTVGASGVPTMQDAEKHCHRLGVRRQVKGCSERFRVAGLSVS